MAIKWHTDFEAQGDQSHSTPAQIVLPFPCVAARGDERLVKGLGDARAEGL
jgi:hypothetical protein